MEKLTKEINFLNLPSSMWCIHIHSQCEFVCILHINISNTKLVVDKGILLYEEKCEMKAKIFLNGFVVHIPNIILDITNISELSRLVNFLHNKNMCRNVDEKEYPDCLKLVDNDSEEDLLYCSMCQEKCTLTELNNCTVEKYEVSEVRNTSPCDTLKFQCQENSKNCNKCICETDVTNHKQQGNLQLCDYIINSDLGERGQLNNKEKEALCNYCGKIFSTGYRIEEHILTHTQEKPFQCKICLKGFSKNFNLRMHEHTHSGDRPYICTVCGKSYTTSSNLRTHIVSSHGNYKKHICGICNMAFVYPRYLKLHMRKHTGERPFVCSTCGKKFSKNIHLTIHIRTHTGEKPHCCDICGKGYTTTGGLGYHTRVHHKSINVQDV